MRLLMGLTVLKIQALLSHIHLPYLAFLRQYSILIIFFLIYIFCSSFRSIKTWHQSVIFAYFLPLLSLFLTTLLVLHIIQGSARQLFRQLQGPMEEDMIKTHFEKIIMISQKLHYHRTKVRNCFKSCSYMWSS